MRGDGSHHAPRIKTGRQPLSALRRRKEAEPADDLEKSGTAEGTPQATKGSTAP
jgi:hypothetical protein